MFKLEPRKLQEYLSSKLGKKAEIKEIKILGSGFHGAAFKVSYTIRGKQKSVVVKLLGNKGFGHDYPADRAQSLINAHHNFNSFPKHVRSFDVVGINRGGDFTSLGECREFMLLMEEVKGVNHFSNWEEINRRGLNENDVKRELLLSDYLVKLHSEKKDSPNLYLRKIRDTVGNGECLMGVIDTYPNMVKFVTQDELELIVKKSVGWWADLRHLSHRLCKIHGDFYPGNIFFNRNRFTLLDCNRGPWGDAADDITAYTINLIHYAIWKGGSWTGPFKDMFDLFLSNYLKKTKDKELLKVVAPFFAFRGVVVIHPFFYPKPKPEVRRKIINFVMNVLDDREFNPNKIPEYLGE